MKFRAKHGMLPVALAVVVASFATASADIIEIEGATSCPVTGGPCNGRVPWQLSDLLTFLSAPGSIGNGTQKYVDTDNIANTFSFSLTSTGQNNTGVANNGACQVNGGAKSIFNACSIVDSTGDTTTLHGSQINGVTFPAIIAFGGPNALGATFTLAGLCFHAGKLASLARSRSHRRRRTAGTDHGLWLAYRVSEAPPQSKGRHRLTERNHLLLDAARLGGLFVTAL